MLRKWRSILQKHENNGKAIQQIHCKLLTQPSFHFPTLWNFILRYYALYSPPKAIILFKNLQHRHSQAPFFDSFTYCFLVKAGANSGNAGLAKQLHCFCRKLGFDNHVYVQTGLVDMVMKCGCTVDAQEVFDEMPERNAVSWNALLTGFIKWGDLRSARGVFDRMPGKNIVSWTGIIDGYTRQSLFDEAFKMFGEMARQGVKPSEVTLLAVFPAVWSVGCIEYCQVLHSYGEKNGLNMFDIRVMNCLIDAYAKCGSMESAVKVFEEVLNERKSIVTWTSIIAAFAMHGLATEAMKSFRLMLGTGLRPNRITFLSLLNSCSHGGLVDEGLEIFREMSDVCGILPDTKHYGCLIDMLGRVGRLKEAETVAEKVPSDLGNAVVWRTLLSACSFHGDVEMGVRVTRKIMEIEREYGGDYVVMSNIFAGNGRFLESERVRRGMDEANAAKLIGLSSF